MARWYLGAALAAGSAALVSGGGGAVAQTAFYEGKTLNIIVGTDAGGGFDLYARALGRHINRHIPGKPTTVVQNMPGAGSMKAAEFLYTLAPKDGTTIGIIFPGAVVEPLVSGPGSVRYDPNKFEYLGSADSGTRLCVTGGTSKIKTMEDLLSVPSVFGGSALGSSTTDYAQMMIALTGAKMRIVNGYKSTVDTMLAIERGEADGVCGYDLSSFKAQKPDWFGTPLSNMIVQVSLEPNEELTKMGVPSIWKYVTGENRSVAELIVAQQEFHRPFVAPPGTPPAQLAILRPAFMTTLADTEFLADARKMKLEINPKDGATVGNLVRKLYGAPPALVEKMRKALRP